MVRLTSLKKKPVLFKLTRFFSFLFKGIGKLEKKRFYLFTMSSANPMDFFVFTKLSNYHYQPNYLGYVYRGQIYQMRQIVNSGQHQYHLRFYNDEGKLRVTGHYELTPEWDASDHLAGKDLRGLTKTEREEIRKALGG